MAEAISHATCETALDLDLAAILCSTQSGSTARMVSKYRPRCPIIAVTPVEEVCRRLTLTWGVHPIVVPRTEHIDDMIDVVTRRHWRVASLCLRCDGDHCGSEDGNPRRRTFCKPRCKGIDNGLSAPRPILLPT